MKKKIALMLAASACCMQLAACTSSGAQGTDGNAGGTQQETQEQQGEQAEDEGSTPAGNASAGEGGADAGEGGADAAGSGNAGGETKPDPAEAEGTKLTAAQCREKIEELAATEEVEPEDALLLAEMASFVTYARLLDEQDVLFAEMDDNDRERLRGVILSCITWTESLVGRVVGVKYDVDAGIPAEDALKLFGEVYGETELVPGAHERFENGCLIHPFGDGEPVDMIERLRVYGDGSYYLLTGPMLYESNGEGECFLGYADILFEKKEDSLLGATLLYGRCRDEKIEIAAVETSSELAPASGKTYSGKNLTDGDLSTVWAEGAKGTGVGESVTLRLAGTQLVSGLQIVNGYTADYGLFHDNGLLKEVRVDFGNGNVVVGQFDGYAGENFSSEDLAGGNRFIFRPDVPVMTDTIVVTITEAEAGAKYEDTCVSEMLVY